jgi:DNA-binding NarL/FixJ family response regulator
VTDKKDVLILARKGIHLYCSALAELLQKKGSFNIHILDETSRPISCGMDNPCNLIIFFPGYPVLSSTARVAGLRGKGTKLLMVLGTDIQMAIGHLTMLDVDGIIPSDADYAEFLTAIDALLFRNLKYMSPLLITSLTHTTVNNPFSSLSRKELDVALIATMGKRNTEIAAELNISPKTVNTYKSRIFRKLGIANDMELFRLILENKTFREESNGSGGRGHATRH